MEDLFQFEDVANDNIGKDEELTSDQIEVLDEVSHIIDVEMVNNLDQMYDDMAAQDEVMNMYEKGLDTW